MAEDKMKAILVEGGQMQPGSYPMPIRCPNDILVEVKAAGVNRADTLQRQGKYPPPQGASPLLGLEVAGIVAEAGSKVSQWQKGDKVFGLLPGGGYAQYACMHQNMAMPIPEELNFTEAAALPEVFLTAYQALVWLAKVQKGERVLIHAGASGVGTAAIQIAREMEAEVLVTASAEKHPICLELGARHAIDYKKGSFKDEVYRLTDGEGVDVIIDFVAAPYFQDNLSALRKDGRLVMLALLGGVKLPEANLLPILQKRLSIMGSTLRSRSPEYQARLTRELADFMLPRLRDGRIRPVIDKVYPWEKVNEAHAYMEENKSKGKIILSVE
ncbi:NAD(P)H-quinone oxidoreductase [Nafulsella turpanensis]|uniref:NAD(P)H-quinone oxidoreductase n=1 Tax=Nafulsella turpanensis TaxID=1265690 RepID=UPI0003457636|nr:NAD(P)H-quinone oxidoreductase [Nafulsella turpanensis]